MVQMSVSQCRDRPNAAYRPTRLSCRIQRDKIRTLAATWRNLRNVTRSQRSQTRKTVLSNSIVGNVQKRQILGLVWSYSKQARVNLGGGEGREGGIVEIFGNRIVVMDS